MNFSQTGRIVVMVFFIAAFPFFRCPAKAGDVDRDAVLARFDQIQNIMLDYHVNAIYDRDPIEQQLISQKLGMSMLRLDPQRTEGRTGTFSFLNGSGRMEFTVDQATLDLYKKNKAPIIYHLIETISKTGRLEQFSQQILSNGSKQTALGGIDDLQQHKQRLFNWQVDIGLGLRLFGPDTWLTRDDLATAKVARSNSSSEYAIEFPGDNGDVYTLRFDRTKLYALVSSECRYGTGELGTATASDFGKYGNCFIPHTLVIIPTTTLRDSAGKMRTPTTLKISITNIRLNDPANTPDLYMIRWPAKLQIYDSRTNDRIINGSTTRPLSDDDIRDELSKQTAEKDRILKEAKDRINRVLGTTQPGTQPASRPVY